MLLVSPDGQSFANADQHLRLWRDAASAAAVVAGRSESTVCFDTECWIVRDGQLHRYHYDGRVVSEPQRLPAAQPAGLIAAGSGQKRAVWHSTPLLQIADDLRATVVTPLPVAGDLCLELDHGGLLVVAGDLLEIRARGGLQVGRSFRVRGLARIRTGAHIGRAIVLDALQATGSRCLVVLEHRNLKVIREIPLAPTHSVDLAGAGTRALVHDRCEARVIDFMRGEDLARWEPDGRTATLSADGHSLWTVDGEHLVRRELGRSPPAHAPAEPPVRATVAGARAVAQPMNEPTSLPRFGQADPSSVPTFLRLGPPIAQPPTPSEADAALRADLDLVGAWCRLAIARAWDIRRIAATGSAFPFQHEIDGLLGAAGGAAPDEVRRAEDLVVKARRARADRQRSATAPSPLRSISQEFGLSAVESTLLLLVAAPVLRGEFARLYSILGNDNARAVCDPMLLEQLLGETVSGVEIAAALDLDAALTRYGLILQGSQRVGPFRPLAPDPFVVRRLRGSSVDAADGGSDTRRVLVARSWGELWLASPVRSRVESELAEYRTRPLRMVVRGRRGAGRKSLIAAACAHAGWGVGLIDVASSTGDASSTARFACELRRCRIRGWVPCLVGLEAYIHADPRLRDDVEHVLDQHPGPVFAIATPEQEVPFPPGHIDVRIPDLTEDQRLQAWRGAVAEQTADTEGWERLASRYRIGMGTLMGIVQASRDQHTAPMSPEGTEVLLRQTLDHRMSNIAARVERLPDWSAIVLPPETLDSVRDFISRVQYRRTVLEEWGFDRVMTTSRGLSALFRGVPGTGKTMIAGVIARELGLDLYRVDLSKIVSKWLGETERNLAALFDGAEQAHAIILFDEADSLFGKRTDVKSSNDRYANLEVNYLLQRLDTFEGVAILTTNFGTAIDDAFLRRLTLQVTLPFPDEELRAELWRVHIPSTAPRDPDLEFEGVAHKYQLSGGYIRNSALRAAFLAAREGVPIATSHLERAVQLEFREVGKLSSTGTLA